MTRMLLFLSLIGLTLSPLAAAAAPYGHVARAGCPAPSAVSFTRAAGATVGTLRWKAAPGSSAVAYRVYRSGRVVGQTTKLAMKVHVRLATSYVFAVRAVLHGGSVAACGASLAAANAYRLPSRPRGLRAAVAGGRVVLRWRAATRGDALVSGYRILRDGSVLGQTKARSKSFPLAAGRVYSFAVVAIDALGHTGRAAIVTVTTSYDAPLAPTDLTATPAGDTKVHLAWKPPLRGADRIVGYRVMRDGALVTQKKALSADVSVVAGRTASFAVVSVDGRGQFSAPSREVTATTTYSQPTAPAGVVAGAVSESEIDLSWSPSRAGGGGRIVGYRVFRGGSLVRQSAGTSLAVTGLAPQTSYTFTVVAVDGRGQLSPASDAVSATTAKPVPSTGTVQAFLLSTTDQSFRDLQAHYRQIGTVYPTYYDCNADGSISGKDDALITSWAVAREIRVMPRFNCQRAATVHAILTDPQLRASTLAALVTLGQADGASGINLDLEAGPASDRAALVSFAGDLAAGLHAAGKQLTVDVSAKAQETTTGRSGFYDYRGIAANADQVFVMAWGLHWTTSVPGPLAAWDWEQKIVSYVGSLNLPGKFVIGFPLYGLDWANGGGASNPATPLEYSDITKLIDSAGANVTFDPAEQESTFSYTSGGTQHAVWFENAQSVSARVALARQIGAGVGFWRIGREDQAIWSDPQIQP